MDFACSRREMVLVATVDCARTPPAPAFCALGAAAIAAACAGVSVGTGGVTIPVWVGEPNGAQLPLTTDIAGRACALTVQDTAPVAKFPLIENKLSETLRIVTASVSVVPPAGVTLTGRLPVL